MLFKEHGATVFGVCLGYDILIVSRKDILRYEREGRRKEKIWVGARGKERREGRRWGGKEMRERVGRWMRGLDGERC